MGGEATVVNPSRANIADVPESGVLERILAARRQALAQAKQAIPAAELEERAAAAPPARRFAAALTRNGMNVIAELKKASPSAGVLRSPYNPAALATAFEGAGACALSVLTEPEFFQGTLEDLQLVRKVTSLPLLRKDFLFDPYQLFEARAAGADAFLLIAAILARSELQTLIQLGRQLGMEGLVEVHTGAELARALEAGAEFVGINNRDLRSLEVSLETSLRLIEEVPENCVAVSESGLQTPAQLQKLRAAGFDAFLIGEHLMRLPEPARGLRVLLGTAG